MRELPSAALHGLPYSWPPHLRQDITRTSPGLTMTNTWFLLGAQLVFKGRPVTAWPHRPTQLFSWQPSPHLLVLAHQLMPLEKVLVFELLLHQLVPLLQVMLLHFPQGCLPVCGG